MAKRKFKEYFSFDNTDRTHAVKATPTMQANLETMYRISKTLQADPICDFELMNREFNQARHAILNEVVEDIKAKYSYVGKRLEQLIYNPKIFNVTYFTDLLWMFGGDSSTWGIEIEIIPIETPEEPPQQTSEAIADDDEPSEGVADDEDDADEGFPFELTGEEDEPDADVSPYDEHDEDGDEASDDATGKEATPMENETTFVLVDGISLVTLPVNFKGFIQTPWYASIVPSDPASMTYRVVLWEHIDYGEIYIAEHTHFVHGATYGDVQREAATVLELHLIDLGYEVLKGEVPTINADRDRQYGDTLLQGYHHDVVVSYTDVT